MRERERRFRTSRERIERREFVSPLVGLEPHNTQEEEDKFFFIFHTNEERKERALYICFCKILILGAKTRIFHNDDMLSHSL